MQNSGATWTNPLLCLIHVRKRVWGQRVESLLARGEGGRDSDGERGLEEGWGRVPSLQPVTAERVLHSGIGQQGTGVAQHVEPFQAQGLHAQLLLQPQPQLQPSC